MRRENSWTVVGDPVPSTWNLSQSPANKLQNQNTDLTALPLPWHKHLLFQPNPQAKGTRQIRGEKFVRVGKSPKTVGTTAAKNKSAGLGWAQTSGTAAEAPRASRLSHLPSGVWLSRMAGGRCGMCVRAVQTT